MKDTLFNRETVSRLAGHFEDAGVFAAAPFVDQVMAGLAPLELKARIGWIADVLSDHLPRDFVAASDAILAALPPPLDPTLRDDDFGHFIYAPLGVFVENHGTADHFSRSLDVLEQITQRFSMEFSIRAFLNADAEAVLDRMQDWAHHPHYHVRRLVSEGTRPRLPWGQNVGLTTAQTLPLLDRLYGDDTRFVTRSVANHLNDITKFAPEEVLERLAFWQSARAQSAKELDWMTRHSLRGLVKAGHAGAMAHLGYAPDVVLHDARITIAPADLERGDQAQIAVSFRTETRAPLIVDYVVDFVKGNGSTAGKTFKLKTFEAAAQADVRLVKAHHFKADATTFKLYPGAHAVHLQINGQRRASAAFTLR